jgi:hypothetical protein
MPLVLQFAADLSSSGHYVKVGPIQIAVANLIAIGLMIVVFLLAVFLPFPRGKR